MFLNESHPSFTSAKRMWNSMCSWNKIIGMALFLFNPRANSQYRYEEQEIKDCSKSKNVCLIQICNSTLQNCWNLSATKSILSPEHFRFLHWTNTNHQRSIITDSKISSPKIENLSSLRTMLSTCERSKYFQKLTVNKSNNSIQTEK